MSYRQNDAFAGKHMAAPSAAFDVEYRRAYFLESFNKGIPRGHADYKKVGWYWRESIIQMSPGTGPFSSSRKAYKDAMATLAKSEAA